MTYGRPKTDLTTGKSSLLTLVSVRSLAAGIIGLLSGVFCVLPAHAAQLEEIVVTAQKRAQTLQNVPFSVTAFSGQQIQDLGMTNAKDVAMQVPGVVMQSPNGNSSPIFTIRGIGLTDFTVSNNSATSVYVDQVVKPFYPMVDFSLFDIKRVEVLKGPQGTLYGENNTGGAIRFITRKPTMTPDGYITLGYGNYNTFEFTGAAGGPIIDNTLAARLAVHTQQRLDGYQYNNYTGKRNGKINRLSGRLSLTWLASSNLKADLMLYGGRNNSDVPQFKLAPPFDPKLGSPHLCADAKLGIRARDGSCVDILGQYDPDPNVNHIQSNNVLGHGINESAGGGVLTINWTLPGMTVTSVTGYDHDNRVEHQDFDATPKILVDNAFTQHISSFSQELRATSPDSSRIHWVGGLYYLQDKLDNDQKIRTDDYLGVPNGTVNMIWTMKTHSYAAFGQIEYPIIDHLSVLAGLRYTHEKRTFDGGTIPGLIPFLPTVLVNHAITANDLSGKVGLNYKPSEDLLFYVSASKGFKSGGFNGAFATNPIIYEPYGPEKLYAYEAGFKSTLFQHSLRFNVSLYHYDWKDFQATITKNDPVTNIPVQVLTNAGNARVNGVEVETLWHPVTSLNLSLNGAWSDGKIISGQLKGLRLANDPRFSMNGLARYDHPVPTLKGNVFLQTDFSYRSSYDTSLLTPTTRPFVIQKAFWLVNGRIGYSTDNGKIEVSAWVKNIFNKRYLLTVFDQGSINSLDLYAEPRTYGLSLTYKPDL